MKTINSFLTTIGGWTIVIFQFLLLIPFGLIMGGVYALGRLIKIKLIAKVGLVGYYIAVVCNLKVLEIVAEAPGGSSKQKEELQSIYDMNVQCRDAILTEFNNM